MVGGIIQGVAGLGQMVMGAIDNKKANKALRNLNRPEYEIPDEVIENVTTSERLALQGLNEEQKILYLENQQQAQQGALNQMKTLGGGARGLSDILRSQNDSNKNLLAMDASARMQNIQAMIQQKSKYADALDNKWSINQYQPYMQERNMYEAMAGAGKQNIFGGLSTIAQGAMNTFGVGGVLGGGKGNKVETPNVSNAMTQNPQRNIPLLTTNNQTNGLDMSNSLSVPTNPLSVPTNPLYDPVALRNFQNKIVQGSNGYPFSNVVGSGYGETGNYND